MRTTHLPLTPSFHFDQLILRSAETNYANDDTLMTTTRAWFMDSMLSIASVVRVFCEYCIYMCGHVLECICDVKAQSIIFSVIKRLWPVSLRQYHLLIEPLYYRYDLISLFPTVPEAINGPLKLSSIIKQMLGGVSSAVEGFESGWANVFSIKIFYRESVNVGGVAWEKGEILFKPILFLLGANTDMFP